MELGSGLSIRHIARSFDGTHAVDDVSFDVQRGELVALVGASGSGKTTTLRMVAGYEMPDRGEVRFDDQDITRVPPDKRGFGMVFQHYALFPHMPVVENVAFGLEARGIGKAERLRRAEQTLASVGLAEKGARRIQQLSGGEQQRVALARALVIEPRMLLLDEPLSNLDPALRESTRAELRTVLQRVGAPALFVTHDQEDAFAIADRVVLLSKGKVLQIGSPVELYQHPVSRAVATFIGKAALVPAEDRGDSAVVTIGGVSHTLAVRRADGATGRFVDAHVLLRPEALALTDVDAHDAWNGDVADSRFAGASYVHRVRLSDEVTVEVLSGEPAPRAGRVGVAVRRLPVPLVP